MAKPPVLYYFHENMQEIKLNTLKLHTKLQFPGMSNNAGRLSNEETKQHSVSSA